MSKDAWYKKLKKKKKKEGINKFKSVCLYTSILCSNYNFKKGNKAQQPQTIQVLASGHQCETPLDKT